MWLFPNFINQVTLPMPGISRIFINTIVGKLYLPHPLKTQLATNSQGRLCGHVVSMPLKGVFVGYTEGYFSHVFLLSLLFFCLANLLQTCLWVALKKRHVLNKQNPYRFLSRQQWQKQGYKEKVCLLCLSLWVGPGGTREAVTVLDWVRLRSCKEDRSFGGIR